MPLLTQKRTGKTVTLRLIQISLPSTRNKAAIRGAFKFHFRVQGGECSQYLIFNLIVYVYTVSPLKKKKGNVQKTSPFLKLS